MPVAEADGEQDRGQGRGADADGDDRPPLGRLSSASVMVERILVIKLGALGNVVLSLGPFAAIRQRHSRWRGGSYLGENGLRITDLFPDTEVVNRFTRVIVRGSPIA